MVVSRICAQHPRGAHPRAALPRHRPLLLRACLKMGSAGNLPAPVGNLPTGTPESTARKQAAPLDLNRHSHFVGLVARQHRLAACAALVGTNSEAHWLLARAYSPWPTGVKPTCRRRSPSGSAFCRIITALSPVLVNSVRSDATANLDRATTAAQARLLVARRADCPAGRGLGGVWRLVAAPGPQADRKRGARTRAGICPGGG